MEALQERQMDLSGYYPGAIGKVTELHAVYYHENWGFDLSFEAQVGRELSEFLTGMNSERDGFWTASVNGRFAGAVAVDGSGFGAEGARLRWYIVDPEFQGTGVGKALIAEAIRFCREREFNKVFLWTFEGLDTARHLYEREGFRLVEENRVTQWGTTLTEQKFEMRREE